MEITGFPRNSAKFAVAEAPGRDGRITKHCTLLKTIIGFLGTRRNSAEFAVAKSPGGMGQIRNIAYFKRLPSKLPESRGILWNCGRALRARIVVYNVYQEITGFPRNSAKFAVAEAPGTDGMITKHSIF